MESFGNILLCPLIWQASLIASLCWIHYGCCYPVYLQSRRAFCIAPRFQVSQIIYPWMDLPCKGNLSIHSPTPLFVKNILKHIRLLASCICECLFLLDHNIQILMECGWKSIRDTVTVGMGIYFQVLNNWGRHNVYAHTKIKHHQYVYIQLI